MRTTWLILIVMILAGGGMYYFATRKKPIAPHDTIILQDTPDSIRSKIRLFVAYNPTEITYKDSTWYERDSIPLKQVPLDSATNAFDKHYQSATFYLDYDHAWFYDIEVNKPKQDLAYTLRFAISKMNDTLHASGIIDDLQHDQLRLSGPMMKMYQAFLLTYNNKLPPAVDSTAKADSTADSATAAPSATPASKTITVIRN